MPSDAKVSTCLWFDGNGEEAVRFRGEVQPQSLGLGRDTQPRDDRHLLAVSAIATDHGSLPDFRPRSPHQRIEKPPRFIDQDQVGVRLRRFFSRFRARAAPSGSR